MRCYSICTGTCMPTVRPSYGYRCTTRYGTDMLRVRYGRCVGHIVRPKSKQDGGIYSFGETIQNVPSVGSGIDAYRTGKRKL